MMIMRNTEKSKQKNTCVDSLVCKCFDGVVEADNKVIGRINEIQSGNLFENVTLLMPEGFQ